MIACVRTPNKVDQEIGPRADSRYTYDEGTQQPGRIDRSTQFYSAWTLFCVLVAGLDAGDHADEAGAAVRRRRRHVKGGSADRVEVRYRAKSFRQVGGRSAEPQGSREVEWVPERNHSRRGDEDQGIGPHGLDVKAIRALLPSSHHR